MLMSLEQIEAIRSTGTRLAVVAVCTYKRPNMLCNCLSSLMAQNIPPDVIMKVVVIDNDAERGAYPVWRSWANIAPIWTEYHCQPKRGIAAARNRAIEVAILSDADYLCFIDDDAVADENWLAGLTHADYQHTHILSGFHIFDWPEGVAIWSQPIKSKKLPDE